MKDDWASEILKSTRERIARGEPPQALRQQCFVPIKNHVRPSSPCGTVVIVAAGVKFTRTDGSIFTDKVENVAVPYPQFIPFRDPDTDKCVSLVNYLIAYAQGGRLYGLKGAMQVGPPIECLNDIPEAWVSMFCPGDSPLTGGVGIELPRWVTEAEPPTVVE